MRFKICHCANHTQEHNSQFVSLVLALSHAVKQGYVEPILGMLSITKR